MAHHDYLGLEGGEKMVEFIVRMCTLSNDEVIILFAYRLFRSFAICLKRVTCYGTVNTGVLMK